MFGAQEVTIKLTRRGESPAGIKSADIYSKRAGFWGTVLEAHPESNTVKVYTDTGHELDYIPVASMEWVTYNRDLREGLTGSRDLPEPGSFVFCVMPTFEYGSAFVLCGGFSAAGAHGALKGAGECYARVRERRTAGGWVILEDKRNGDARISGPKSGGRLEMVQTKEEVHIEAFGSALTMSESGFDISSEKEQRYYGAGRLYAKTLDRLEGVAAKGAALTIEEGDVVTQIEKGNKDTALKEGNAGLSIEKGDVKVALQEGSAEATIAGGGFKASVEKEIAIEGQDAVSVKSGKDFTIDAMGKVIIKGGAGSLLALLKELIGEIKGLQTVGGNTAQATAPQTIAKLVALEAKLDAVLGE